MVSRDIRDKFDDKLQRRSPKTNFLAYSVTCVGTFIDI